MPEPLAIAVHDARELAEREPNAFGYPYADRLTGTLVLSPVNAAGEASAQRWTPRPEAAGVPRTVRKVNRGYAELERIRHEAIGPGVAAIPDSKLIWMSTADEERNRVILTVDRISNALLQGLASRYGTEVIAIRVQQNPGIKSLSRQSDVNPFYGGAKINLPGKSCTTGFPFLWNGYHRMITAGHCAPDGGYVYSNSGAGMGW